MNVESSEPSRDPAPWLSLLVPVYNVEAYLDACVGSLLAQDLAGVEVLLLDDASTDASAERMRALHASAPDRIRLLAHPRNAGLAAARNTLLGHARGRYAWFVDSDDVLLPGAVRGLRDVVELLQPDLVLCDFRMLRERFGLKHRLRGELHRRTFDGPARVAVEDRDALVEGLLSAAQLHTWSKIARREIWAQAPFPEGRFYEDIAVIAPLVAATTRAVHVPEAWVGYRQRAGSIMASLTPARLLHLDRSLGELHDGLTALQPPLSRSARFALDYFCLKTYASVARRTAGLDAPEARALQAACRASLLRMYPQGIGDAVAAWRRRGWWLRARRIPKALAHAGWLA